MMNPAQHKIIQCKQCNEPISLPLGDLHRSCVCAACQTYHVLTSVQQEQGAQLPSFTGKIIFEPNTEVVFRGVKYLVLGCVERFVTGYTYNWREYHIWNQETGIVFLSEFKGNWTFLKKSKERPRYLRQYRNVLYQYDSIFEMYSNDSTEMKSAVGSFLMKIDARVRYMEYICPPHLISTEISGDAKWWFTGEYVDRSEILAAAPANKVLPVAFGVHALKPNPVTWNKFQMGGVMAAYALLVVLFAFLFGGSSSNLGSFAFKIPSPTQQSAKDSLYVSRPFEVDRLGSVTIHYSSGLVNSWMYVDGSLINEGTGEEYYFGHDMEHYSGVEGGYAWSEGDNTTDQVLSSIPQGRYRIQFKIEQSVAGNESVLSLQLVHNETITSNIVLFVFLGGAIMLIVYLRYRAFEYRRWENSDYSPYQQDEEY